MPTQAPGRFWIIRHPSNTGSVVAKADTAGGTQIPDAITDHSEFTIIELADRSALSDKSIDHSGLTEAEKDLLESIYPVY